MTHLQKIQQHNVYKKIGHTLALLLMSLSMTTLHADTKGPFDKGMHVILTGTGSGPSSVTGGGAGVAVIVDDTLLQFDAGPKTQENLVRSGVLPPMGRDAPGHKINYLFFTHLHVDHTANFVYMRGWPYYVFSPSYRVFGPASTKAMSDAAADFNAVQYQEMDAFARKWPGKAGQDLMSRNLRYPAVEEIPREGGVVVNDGNVKVTAAPSTHMVSEHAHSFAYRVDSRYGSVVISGDTVPSLKVVELASNADVLVHEAPHAPQRPDDEFVALGDSTDTLKTNHQMVHTRPSEAGKVAAKAGVKTLVTYHHGFKSDSPCEASDYTEADIARKEEVKAIIGKQFKGEVLIGEPCMVITID